MDDRREEFGQRRAHRLLPGGPAREVQVGIDGEADTGQQVLVRAELLAGESHRLAQLDPGIDPSLAVPPVVVEEALNPEAPDIAVRAVGEDRGVLARDVDLVVEAVRHPAAEGLAVELSRVHPLVELVVDVVEALQRTQLALEFLAGPGRCGGVAHAPVFRDSWA